MSKSILKTSFYLYCLIFLSVANAQDLTFVQNDWSGGGGQEFYSNTTMFWSEYGIDFSTNGRLGIDHSESGYVYGLLYHNDKIYVSKTYGMFEYDPLINKWKNLIPYYYAYKNMFIHDSKLYAVGGNYIVAYNFNNEDYGLGENGFEPVTKKGLPEEFGYHYGLDFQGDLYIAGVMWINNISNGGRVYKLVDSSWVQVGQEIENAITSIGSYNGELYAGTHWSGKLYKLSGGTWVNTGIAKGMSINDLIEWNGNLYIASWNTNQSTGQVLKYNGTSAETIFTGNGINKLHAGMSLYFGGFSSKNVYQYDGSSTTTYVTLPGSGNAIGGITSIGTQVYYMAGYNGVVENVDNALYMNGTPLSRISCGLLYSSIIELPSAQDWGGVFIQTYVGDQTGVQLLTISTSDLDKWDTFGWRAASNYGESKMFEKYGRYAAFLWTGNDQDSPLLSEVVLGADVQSEFLIYDVEVKALGGNDVIVVWRTNRPAKGFLFYGTDPEGEGYPFEVQTKDDYDESHLAYLHDLNKGEEYHLMFSMDDYENNNTTAEGYSFIAGDETLGAPKILSINDIPEDQGKWVYVKWSADPLDRDGERRMIDSYGLWEFRGDDTLSHGLIPAVGLEKYTVQARTYKDSTSDGIFWSKFLVTSHSYSEGFIFVSQFDSGYSVDNLYPEIPSGLNGEVSNGSFQLTWLNPVDEDFAYFNIYKFEGANFNHELAILAGQTTLPSFTDDSINQNSEYTYSITAVDANGNESDYSDSFLLSVTDIGVQSTLPQEVALLQNFPNPFNPSTIIKYELPEEAHVQLMIFNALGELITTLVNENKSGGYHSVEFFSDSSPDHQNLPSGIYIYRLVVNNKILSNKMLLMK
ncbi:MAG: T9SS type A sorting domain-containing protein [Melioribacteraceae bacterium]|nr:T9SS type A sorting domain-containing protein [Melioribacteraceae bacterium]